MAVEPKLSHTAAMILQAIHAGYGYGFSVMEITGLPSGTVYPAMRRLEQTDLVRSQSERQSTADAEPRPEAPKMSRLESPVRCVLFLALLAAASLFLAIRAAYILVEGEPPVRELLILLNLHALLITFLVLPAITSLRLGEYPANSHSP